VKRLQPARSNIALINTQISLLRILRKSKRNKLGNSLKELLSGIGKNERMNNPMIEWNLTW
jgi:hypothetical protein